MSFRSECTRTLESLPRVDFAVVVHAGVSNKVKEEALHFSPRDDGSSGHPSHRPSALAGFFGRGALGPRIFAVIAIEHVQMMLMCAPLSCAPPMLMCAPLTRMCAPPWSVLGAVRVVHGIRAKPGAHEWHRGRNHVRPVVTTKDRESLRHPLCTRCVTCITQDARHMARPLPISE